MNALSSDSLPIEIDQPDHCRVFKKLRLNLGIELAALLGVHLIRYTERLAEAGIEPSVGSVGDSYDNALAETINGLYKAKVIRQLVLIASDDLIAGILNRNGLVTGHGNRWTRERVTAHRSHHKIPVFLPAPDGNEPWLNLNKAARLLGVAPKTLRIAAEAGEVEGVHPLPDGPWIFSRSELAKPHALQIAHRARQNPKYPAGSNPDQQSLFTSTT